MNLFYLLIDKFVGIAIVFFLCLLDQVTGNLFLYNH